MIPPPGAASTERPVLGRSVEELRADTPGCAHRVHLNNAGAALPPSPVIRAVHGHLELEEAIGGYEAADARAEAIEGAYRDVGSLVGAPEGTIAFTSSATESFARALSSVPWRRGDLLLTTRNDYVSNQVQYLSLAARFGVELIRAPDHPDGGVDVGAMEELIHRRRPRLVSVTHVPTSSGLVQPVEEIGVLCRARGIPYLVDACQSAGQMPLDVEAIGCDFLSATSRKFLRGPRGAGFLFVSQRVLDAGWEPLLPDLRGADWVAPDLYQPAPDARRFENWESAPALVLGTGAAARYALETGVAAIRDRIRSLAGRIRDALGQFPQFRVLDRGPELCGIVTVSVPGREASALVGILRSRGLNVSAVDRLSALLDFEDKGVESALRISPHAYNTEEEVDLVPDLLKDP